MVNFSNKTYKAKDAHMALYLEEETAVPSKSAPDCWTMHFDGGFSSEGSGAGIVLTSPTGDKLYYAVQL